MIGDTHRQGAVTTDPRAQWPFRWGRRRLVRTTLTEEEWLAAAALDGAGLQRSRALNRRYRRLLAVADLVATVAAASPRTSQSNQVC